MALQIDVGDRDSIIVVTLSGGTDVAALEPIRDALLAAVQEGRTVILDLNRLADLDALALTQFLDRIETIGDRVRVVTGRPEIRRLLTMAGKRPTRFHATVEAALAAGAQRDTASDPTSPNDRNQGTSQELRAMFADLEDQYLQAIERCRQLLDTAEHQQPFRPAPAGPRSGSAGGDSLRNHQSSTIGRWNGSDADE